MGNKSRRIPLEPVGELETRHSHTRTGQKVPERQGTSEPLFCWGVYTTFVFLFPCSRGGGGEGEDKEEEEREKRE